MFKEWIHGGLCRPKDNNNGEIMPCLFCLWDTGKVQLLHMQNFDVQLIRRKTRKRRRSNDAHMLFPFHF